MVSDRIYTVIAKGLLGASLCHVLALQLILDELKGLKLKQEGGWEKEKTVECTGCCDTRDLIEFACELPKLYVVNEFEEDIPPCFPVLFTVEH